MADFQSALTAAQIETVLTDAIVPTRGKPLTEAEKIQAREYIGASALGEGIKILAHFDTLDELKAAVPTPKAGDAYSVGIELPHSLYACDFYHNEWHDYGPIRSDDITARLARNLVVAPGAWEEDTTVFAEYTFKAAIPLGEITGNDFSIVAFSPSDAAGGNFCPVAFAFDGYVEIWAIKKPEAEIIIPAVTFIALGGAAGETGNSTKGITNAGGKSSQSLSVSNIIVPDQAWELGGNEAGFPYRAAIALPGSEVDETWAVDVAFENPSENLSGLTLSYDGGFYIFAASPPESLVKILTAICSQTEVKEFANEVFATISVTYKEGETVTCTNGATTLTAKTTSGSWQFGVPHAGEWVVSNGTKTEIVNITTQGQTESVALVLYLYKAGNEYTEVTGGWQARAWAIAEGYSAVNLTTQKASEYIYAKRETVGNANNYSGALEIAKDVDLTPYKTICIDYFRERAGGNAYADFLVADRSGTYATSNSYVRRGNLPTNERQVVEIDVSNVNRSADLAFMMFGWGDQWDYIRMYNVWLE